MANDTPPTDPDAVLTALRHPVRRWVLRTLTAGTRTNLATLADACITSDHTATGEDYRAMVLSFQHVHLPILVDAGLIQCDHQNGEIALHDASAARLNSVIEDLEQLRNQHE